MDQYRGNVSSFSPLQILVKTGVSALHVGKRLFNFRGSPQTVYFPLVVNEVMMIEPTETVSKQEFDAMIAGFERMSEEAYSKSSWKQPPGSKRYQNR
jgi:glycine dehydrogenase subunit 2